MRLLLRYRTGDTNHPDGDVSVAQVRKVLGVLGWIPKESAFATGKLAHVIGLLPESIRSEVEAGEPVLITPRPGLWGIVSAETHNQLYIRLIDHELATLRSVAEKVVEEFPSAFRQETGRDIGFDPEVAIRRFDSEIRIVVGRIEDHHVGGFWRYSRTQRRREYFLVLFLATLTALTVGASVAAFTYAHGAVWDYWRGYLDRGGSTFVTAALTTLINLNFEFRDWRNDKRRINWSD